MLPIFRFRASSPKQNISLPMTQEEQDNFRVNLQETKNALYAHGKYSKKKKHLEDF